ncbi:universal stress protein [Methylocystis bryophila]|uniref:Universal stress protein n=2 Tax=Methylocystis bryophila TaxID=655015 RepID=A0A1W6N1H9_9HYPH|nr:universal stress protein [Methylocystis bryophila]
MGEGPVRRVMIAVDGSQTSDRAARWAALFADLYGAELLVVQVIVPQDRSASTASAADHARADAARAELPAYARSLAGERGRGLVFIDPDPAGAIIAASKQEAVDVLVVGNLGMTGRKEFLLGNVPNRISHNARCTVIIVNTAREDAAPKLAPRAVEEEPPQPRRAARGANIAAIAAKHGLRELFNRPDPDGATGRRRQAKRLRAALEELGPTFSKLGQILSTRPDLLPPEFISELASLQNKMPPMSEAEVVSVMEKELGVPWEDVFHAIESKPLAAGTIGQVHRATLVGGERVVVKVQRPSARGEIEQDLALFEAFATEAGGRRRLQKVMDVKSVFQQLSQSLQRELDFSQEAANLERMAEVVASYDRLAVPAVYKRLSTPRLLVMEEVQGEPVAHAPEGSNRAAAARQLLESFYKQIVVDGFFHADPHPGNLMWWKDRIYFLDLGMVGVLDGDLREQLMLLLMAFWQEDAQFLTDVTFMLSGDFDSSRLEPQRYQAEIGGLMAKYRKAGLAEMQIGPILQEMTGIAMSHGVPLPASLTLVGKAFAQVQLATAQLDPTIDPFDVAGQFLQRAMLKAAREKLSTKTMLYEAQKLKVRAARFFETVEKLIGARPGQNLEVKFLAHSLEEGVRRTGRQLTFGMIATASLFSAGFTAGSPEHWPPIAFGLVGAVLTLFLLVDMARGR